MEKRNTHLGQVPGQLTHHINYNLIENTLCQLWCQRLAGNTVAFLLAFNCLQVYTQPVKTKQIQLLGKEYTGVCPVTDFNVLFLFNRVNCNKT